MLLRIGDDVHNLAWTMVNDGVETNTRKGHSHKKSFTPFQLICLNLPPWLRTNPGFIITLGMVPENQKNLQPYLGLLADQLDAMKDGLPVFDAHEGRDALCYSRLLAAINDLRALPQVGMWTQSPAVRWACHYCNTMGIHVALLSGTVYPGAVRLLSVVGSPRRRALTREWRNRFAGMPEALALADRPMFKRDAKFNETAGKLAEQGRKISKASLQRARHAGGYVGYGTSMSS